MDLEPHAEAGRSTQGLERAAAPGPASGPTASSARAARRHLLGAPFMAVMVFHGITQLHHDHSAWAGWMMVGGGTLAIAAAVVAAARRRPPREGEHGSAVLIGVDVMGAFLALAVEGVSWPVRIAVAVVVLTATILLYLDQRQPRPIADEA